LSEVLCHNVGKHVGGREVCSFDGVLFTGITDEVEADADMLGVLMELQIFYKLDCALIVDIRKKILRPDAGAASGH